MKNLTLLATCLFILISCKEDPPVASFNISKQKVYIEESVSFTNQTTNGDSFLWDFGDNTTSTEMSPTHNFITGGPKTVVLTATNKGGEDVEIKKVNVYEGRSSYQVKNNTTSSLLLSSFYWDGYDIYDMVIHGTLSPGSVSDTTFTSREKLNLGGQLYGTTFIVTTSYPISEHQHNLLVIDNNSPIYAASSQLKSMNPMLEKLDNEFNK